TGWVSTGWVSTGWVSTGSGSVAGGFVFVSTKLAPSPLPLFTNQLAPKITITIAATPEPKRIIRRRVLALCSAARAAAIRLARLAF
ncbi:MAG: hypothetical protein KTV16_14615, partial [Acidimicrobiia bacterium]|nr:hypothetical protein [Acidimicrobiia bacterium]